MNGDLISREALNNALENRYLNYEFEKRGLPRLDEMSLDCYRALEAQGNVIRDVLYEQPAVEINGDTSDGYHTFNELYHHRAVLFSVIVKAFPDKAWKARKHHDGTMYDGMFIVGINTPHGQATYHYDIDPYWDMFACRELERAPEWDGHTPEEAINRIGQLIPLRVTRCKDCAYYEGGEHFHDMQFCCRLHGEDGTPARYNFAPDAFCSYGETPEEKQQREAAEQDAWESMQMMCNPEDGSL